MSSGRPRSAAGISRPVAGIAARELVDEREDPLHRGALGDEGPLGAVGVRGFERARAPHHRLTLRGAPDQVRQAVKVPDAGRLCPPDPRGGMTALLLYRPGHSHFRVRVVYGCSERDMTNDEYTQLIAFLSAQFTKVDGRFRIVDASLAQIRSEMHELRTEVDDRFRQFRGEVHAEFDEIKGPIRLDEE